MDEMYTAAQELERLNAEQKADDTSVEWTEFRDTVSLDLEIEDDSGNPTTLGESLLVAEDNYDKERLERIAERMPSASAATPAAGRVRRAIEQEMNLQAKLDADPADDNRPRRPRLFEGGHRSARKQAGCRPWDRERLEARRGWRTAAPTDLPEPFLLVPLFLLRCHAELGYFSIKQGRGNKPAAEVDVIRRFAWDKFIEGWPMSAITRATGRSKSTIAAYVKRERDQRAALLASLEAIQSASGIDATRGRSDDRPPRHLHLATPNQRVAHAQVAP